MSLQDLGELQAALAAVEKAGIVLDKAGLVPSFDLSGRGTLIRCAPLWDGGTAPDVMIEDADTGAAQEREFPGGGGIVAVGMLCDMQTRVRLQDEHTGAAQDPGPAAGCDHGADRPEPPAEIAGAQHGVFPGGGQDLSASQPGLTEAAVRAVETDSAEAPAPAGAAPESLVPDPGPAAEEQTPAGVGKTPPAVEAPRPGARGDSAGTGVQPPVVTARGELTAAERVAIAEAHARGEEPRMVAARLGRRTQLVAQLYTKMERGEVKVPPTPTVAVPAKVAARPAVTDQPVRVPAPVKAAKPVAAAPAPRPSRGGCPDDLTGEHRRIWTWLDGLGYRAPFDAALDLALVEAFGKGVKLNQLALDLGIDAEAVKDRYLAVTRPIRDSHDRIRFDLQPKLVLVLRRRTAGAGAADRQVA